MFCPLRFFFFLPVSWQLLTERDDATGELHNIVRVSPNSKLRLQLPEKAS